jgi:hypothetical protein
MKIAVINFSGDVGKSTIARHLLLPRIPGAEVITIESLNADECQGQALRGRQFGELQEYLQTVASVVVDIQMGQVPPRRQDHWLSHRRMHKTNAKEHALANWY